MATSYKRGVVTAAEWAAELEERDSYDWRRKPTPTELGYRGATSYLNGFENGGSWDRRFEVHTEYYIRPEGNPEGSYPTEYWEIVTVDAPPVTQMLREHFGSFCNQSETQRQFERLLDAQRRARIILAMKELESIGGDGAANCIAIARRPLLNPAIRG